MAAYQLSSRSDYVIHTVDGLSILIDGDTFEARQYAAWLSAGNMPDAVDLSAVRTAQIATLSAACQAAITSGFTSTALGSSYTYPSAATDQANLVQVATNSAGGFLWCKSSAGVWAYVVHTQAQAQQVLAAFIAWRSAQQQELVTLTAEVNAATTEAAIEAITWTNGTV